MAGDPAAGVSTDRPIKEKNAAFGFFGGIVIVLLRAIARIRVQHAEHIPASGAFILTPNHYSDIDPLIMAYALYTNHRMPRFLAKESLFRVPLLGGIMRATGQVPVVREKGGRGALDSGARIVRDGLALIVYPEGTLTRDPELWPMRGKSGAVRLALEFGVPIIPAAHWGAQRILPRWSKKISLFPRKKVDIVFGEAVDLSAWQGAPRDAATYAAATEAVMQAITALLEPMRGETAPAERWDPAAHGQSEYGALDEPKG